MVSNNIHQIPCLENAQIIEEWVEEKKVLKPKPKPAATTAPAAEEGKDGKPAEEKPAAEPTPDEYETKTSNKSVTSSIHWETSSYALTPEQRKNFKDIEEQMMLSDKKYLDWKEARNDLESYSYKIRE